VFKFRLHEEQSSAAQVVWNTIKAMYDDASSSSDFRSHYSSAFSGLCRELSLLDIQHVLFKCDQEERAATKGNSGVYVLDGYGPLPYAGLQGLMSILMEIRPKNDLGNWLPANLRNGNWMLDYVTSRLKLSRGTEKLGTWLETEAFAPLKRVPRYLIPRYFDAIITATYVAILEQIW
jgi:glycogen debranching enzyme